MLAYISLSLAFSGKIYINFQLIIYYDDSLTTVNKEKIHRYYILKYIISHCVCPEKK